MWVKPLLCVPLLIWEVFFIPHSITLSCHTTIQSLEFILVYFHNLIYLINHYFTCLKNVLLISLCGFWYVLFITHHLNFILPCCFVCHVHLEHLLHINNSSQRGNIICKMYNAPNKTCKRTWEKQMMNHLHIITKTTYCTPIAISIC
jgi:hypothetical protein